MISRLALCTKWARTRLWRLGSGCSAMRQPRGPPLHLRAGGPPPTRAPTAAPLMPPPGPPSPPAALLLRQSQTTCSRCGQPRFHAMHMQIERNWHLLRRQELMLVSGGLRQQSDSNASVSRSSKWSTMTTLQAIGQLAGCKMD